MAVDATGGIYLGTSSNVRDALFLAENDDWNHAIYSGYSSPTAQRVGYAYSNNSAWDGEIFRGNAGIAFTGANDGKITLFADTVNKKLGIGSKDWTASLPSELLHVYSSADDDPAIKLENGRSGGDGALLFQHRGSSVTMDSTGSDPIHFRMGGTQKMSLLANGNLGIGTDDPKSELNIIGKLRINTSTAYTNYGAVIWESHDGNANINKMFLSAHHGLDPSTDATLTITGGGNAGDGRVGIGTTSPDALLHISGGDILLDNTDEIRMKDSGGTQRGVLLASSDTTVIRTLGTSILFEDSGGGDLVTILQNGNVGIGTASVDTLLHLESSTSGGNCRLKLEDTNADDNPPTQIFVKNSASPAVNDYLGAMYFYGDDNQPAQHTYAGITVQSSVITNGSEEGLMNFATSISGTFTNVMTIKGGNVGIGDSSPSYKLEVAGTFYASGSSQAFKKNVTDLAVDSSAIYNLNPVSYNYKKDYENFGYDLAEGKQFGLISEEVAEAVPELAIMKDGEPKNVDYQKLSVLLLAEMQKMNKRIKDLECHI